MGTADIRKAFDKGAAGAATCSSVTMQYIKGDEPGQKLILVINTSTGQETIERLVPYGVSLITHTETIGAEYASGE